MTDQGKLLDRIARALFNESHLDAPTETIPDEMHPGYYELAQAVIEDLGLTVEEGHITGQGHGLPGVIGTRVVGKWEER